MLWHSWYQSMKQAGYCWENMYRAGQLPRYTKEMNKTRHNNKRYQKNSQHETEHISNSFSCWTNPQNRLQTYVL